MKTADRQADLVDQLFSAEAFLTIPMLGFKWLGGNQSAFSTHLCNVNYILKHTIEH